MSFPGLLPPPRWERRVSYSIFVRRVEERSLVGDTVSPRSGYFIPSNKGFENDYCSLFSVGFRLGRVFTVLSGV